MNRYLRIFIAVLCIIVLIFILYKLFIDKSNDNFISNFQNSQNKNFQDFQDSQNSQNKNYLTMTESDFDKLSIDNRWIYRSKCLEHFPKFKNDYAKREFIYPLPKYQKNGLIFINLASYRDPECHKTVKSLIMNASDWHRLRIVVCEQNAPEDIDCKHDLNEMYHSIIKVISLSYEEARGPTFARFLIQQKYSGEEFYMQIDSHTIFEKEWDTKLIKTLNSLPEKSCLTQYLPDYEIGKYNTAPKLRGNLKVSRICSLDGFSRILSTYLNTNDKFDYPFPSNGWSGCFSFSRGDICYDAPIDCYTPDVFFGEEMDIALRLYTRGWNFYAPNYPIAYTNFNRSYRETFWEKKGKGYNKNITLCSRLRIHYRLGTLPEYLKIKIENEYPELIIEANKFVLGNEKTLKDYEKLIEFKFETEN